MQKTCAREKVDNSVTICDENKSSQKRLRRSGTRTHTGTRTMLSDTNRNEHWHTAFSIVSHAIPFAVRYAGFVLTRFSVRSDGRTPFQYLLGPPHVKPLCMFGESVFALIPDHEVRAAKLTNRWISGLVGTKCGVLECRSVRRKPLGESSGAAVKRTRLEARNVMLMLVWTREYLDHALESRRDEEMPSATVQREIPVEPPPAHPTQLGRNMPEIRGQGVHAKSTPDQIFLVRNRQDSWIPSM